MPGKVKVKKARGRAAASTRTVRRPSQAGSRSRAVRTSGLRMRILSPARGGRVAVQSRPKRAAAAKPLGKREQKEFRRLLEAERERLTGELEALEEHAPEVEHQVGVDLGGTSDEDFADIAGDTFEREKVLAIESSLQALLTQTEEALTKLDEGTYGLCENCGRAIHPARLRAIPSAKLCIDCKSREERANGLVR